MEKTAKLNSAVISTTSDENDSVEIIVKLSFAKALSPYFPKRFTVEQADRQ